jgi:hypothetical protein
VKEIKLPKEDKDFLESLYKKAQDKYPAVMDNIQEKTKNGMLDPQSVTELDDSVMEICSQIILNAPEEKVLKAISNKAVDEVENYLLESGEKKVEPLYQALRSVLCKFPMQCSEYMTLGVFTGGFKTWLEKKYPEDYSKYYEVASQSNEWGGII